MSRRALRTSTAAQVLRSPGWRLICRLCEDAPDDVATEHPVVAVIPAGPMTAEALNAAAHDASRVAAAHCLGHGVSVGRQGVGVAGIIAVLAADPADVIRMERIERPGWRERLARPVAELLWWLRLRLGVRG